MKTTVTLEKEETGRADSVLAKKLDRSRSAVARLCDDGYVTANGCPVSKKTLFSGGEIVTLDEPDPVPSEAVAEDIPLDIVYEDDDILVINKPKGMVVHPAPGNYTGTLVNALLFHCRGALSGIGGVERPGIVHRIDKDTSGLLVVAKNDAAHRALSEELSHHGIVREYRALVRGGFSEPAGIVCLPIGRHPVDRKKMTVLPAGAPGAKEAVTHYEVLSAYGQVSCLKLVLETGRTHQIRVHMSHLGHPLLGDDLYGGNRTLFEKQHAALLHGQALHAKTLTLTHPRTGERMTFSTELPADFTKLLTILRNQNP